MKDLRKIIALFLLIFVVGTTVTLLSINKRLDQKAPLEKVEVSKDTIHTYSRYQKAI